MDIKEAYQKAAAYCAYQDRCSAELREKFRAWEVPEAVAGPVLARLTEEKFLDEARYARSFAGGKFRANKWGKVKIRYALRQKGIASGLIEEALAQIEEGEYRATLQKLASAKKMAKDKWPALYRSLVAKGYEPELVGAVLKMGTD
jgi:regulatory protein